MLSVLNASLALEGKKLFENVSFTALDNCIIILAGANGSGKTSLLKRLAGVAAFDSGEFELSTTPLYIGHKNAMKPELTVRENLLFYAAQENTQMLLDAADKFWQFGERLDEKYENLSAGWQRKCALARMLVTPKKIWLLDEPMANLDKPSREALATLIAAHANQGGTVIVSSHDTQFVKPNQILNLQDFAC